MWYIFRDSHFDKKLDKHRSNKAVINGYKNASLALAHSDSPEEMGDRKYGHLRYSYVYRITKSYRLLYRVDRSKNAIIMVDLDDHKNVYGRD